MRVNIGKKSVNSTQCSQAVTHSSTNRVQHCLTSVTERGLVQHGITVNQKFKSKYFTICIMGNYTFYMDFSYKINREKQKLLIKFLICRSYLRMLVIHTYSQHGSYSTYNGIFIIKIERSSCPEN